ncbi:MAG: T9SS type A sorting domain-containing protein [Bacteroidetes bacterium]|nr:T9SS type A sorting domain-containing protein [Bacteroidota bacterium]
MRILSIILSFLFCGSVFSQEVVTGLQFNKAVQKKFLEEKMLKAGAGDDTIPVTLPFYDDFSANGVFPSSLRWIDRYAFENNDYPVYPIDLGVVTMDAINDSGSMYPDAVAGPLPFIADHLTSRYIRLDSVFTPVPRALTPADSVYLSFYYQPQGRGSAPHTSDTLILQFLLEPEHDSISPVDTTLIPDRWSRTWYANGTSLDTFYINNNLFFKRVMIPITDTLFFKKKFRIQFYNYVSLASSTLPSWQSNCCQWNLDQVYLNYGRNMNDTVRAELRFTERPPSMLKNYISMPYLQYSNDPGNEMRDSLSMILTNRDLTAHSVRHSYSVTQVGGSFSKSYESPSFNLLPYNQYAFGYTTHPPVNFTYPISTADSGLFKVQHVIRDLAPGSLMPDTITAYQRFYNFFAYDDGSAEAGYGLKGTGAMMAYRFNLNLSPDTLRAVRIFFNQTLSQTNQQFFYLTVWNDNSGFPGDTIYSRLAYPGYSDSLNDFKTYRLEKPVRISGAFYVGTIQTTDDNLNIGLDTYDNAAANLFYNVTGPWIASSISGAPMVRPVIGKPLPLGITSLSVQKRTLTVYPNPCNTGRIRLSMQGMTGNQDNNDVTISITGLTGQEVYHSGWTEIIDVSMLPAGMYFIKAQHRGDLQHSVAKLIIMK